MRLRTEAVLGAAFIDNHEAVALTIDGHPVTVAIISPAVVAVPSHHHSNHFGRRHVNVTIRRQVVLRLAPFENCIRRVNHVSRVKRAGGHPYQFHPTHARTHVMLHPEQARKESAFVCI